MALICVFNADDEMMANMVRDILLEENIPAMIHKSSIVSFEQRSFVHTGWGEILVEEEHRERALELVAAFRGTLGELADATVVEEGETTGPVDA